ncbi:MAG: tetratricopeptide repeat protein [Ardenticatenia bacterium]|nr:tetratricopeptide repeat protein [Ardenticatenia bacterium]
MPEGEGFALPVRFWVRLFLGVGAALGFLFVVLGALAVYQGLNDRAVTAARQAITLYEQGQRYYQEGRYELAAAAFREALRLEPELEAAQRALEMAEVAAAQPDQVLSPGAAPVVPEEAWAKAVEAYNAGRFAEAAEGLEQVREAFPSFRAEEVKALLLQAHVQAGEAAEAAGNFAAAVRHFDRALALVPENDAVLRRRRLANAYRRGIEAWDKGDWLMAAEGFRRAYLLDPAYYDVADRLAEAHRRAGDEFFDRRIWCDAAEQYRASLAVQEHPEAAQRAQTAEAKCQQQSSTPLPPPSSAHQEEQQPADQTASSPTATPEGASQYTFLPLRQEVQTDPGGPCVGHYIKGLVINGEQAPVPGVTIVAVDEWGNKFVATSKENPPGNYDIPINAIATTYQVYVVGAAGLPVSPILSVVHDESLASLSVACHVIDWQQQVHD